MRICHKVHGHYRVSWYALHDGTGYYVTNMLTGVVVLCVWVDNGPVLRPVA